MIGCDDIYFRMPMRMHRPNTVGRLPLCHVTRFDLHLSGFLLFQLSPSPPHNSGPVSGGTLTVIVAQVHLSHPLMCSTESICGSKHARCGLTKGPMNHRVQSWLLYFSSCQESISGGTLKDRLDWVLAMTNNMRHVVWSDEKKNIRLSDASVCSAWFFSLSPKFGSKKSKRNFSN